MENNMEQNTNEPVETAQTNSPDQLSNIDKPKTKTKLLWWVLGIVVLVGIAYGGWYLGKKQDTRNNNQTNPKTQNSNI
ncbi:MAG: hypothetical protein UR93_C0029G0008 [Berkelbacteria bacterium GW2011_GWA2_35_9]|uniref:Uncharacterized protein n=1 Tax=Berkelbacteria bacterium GW2011_GWA2_35_9 TaxID=1618333 RepID=A0A0G0G832_9BACT|nr:MAG: hypothetical protein UR93_C0029G0008 [Berkelbacteria bacterium GW2011_GWA2_35_9]